LPFRFLKTINEGVPAAVDAHSILDSYGAQKTVLFCHWSAKRPRHHLQFTPNAACWVHLTERSFALLTEPQLRRGVHRSTWGLGTVVLALPGHYSREVEPFIWTKTADEIWARLAPLFVRQLLTHDASSPLKRSL
jgi:hypothetical protein